MANAAAVKIAKADALPTRPQARPNEIEEVGQSNNPPRIHWCGPGIGQEDLLYQGYWSQLTSRHEFRFGDRIEARAHDRSWVADLFVVAATRDGLTLHVDKVRHLKTTVETADDDGVYTIANHGGPQPWAVVRNKDRHEMSRHVSKGSAAMARDSLYPKKV